MSTFEFTIDLTVPDNTAFTVLTALRALGYPELTRVERSALLRLGIADGAMTVEECARALTHAEIVFNPNKHRLRFGANGPAGSPEAIVEDKDDDTSSLQAMLSGQFGVSGLECVERATAWRLFEGDAPASAERLEWACKELLANSYSQTFVIRNRPASRSL
jgi:phosphoribosylformylglycinamidine (FGAM) synthase PurS component